MQIGDRNVDFEKLLGRLYDPRQLRAFITVLLLVVGYAAVYTPLNGRIEETTRKLKKEQTRHALAYDIEQLRAQVDGFQGRLPEDTDVNEWVQYVLDGIRKSPLKLSTLDSRGTERVGPYEAVALYLELGGTFHNLDAFLHWLEANERLFRVDSAKITPPRSGGNDKLLMQLIILGLKR